MPKKSNADPKLKANEDQPGGSSKRAAPLNSEGESGMDHSELHGLFLEELADSLHAEHQLTKALPRLIAAASSPKLVEALEDHLAETETHIDRLEQVFLGLGEKARKKRCEGMEGILAEGEALVTEHQQSSAADATIIAASQKAEHYEMATYGTLIAWARQMGHEEAVSLLEETLEEEKAADATLTEIAIALANPSAEE